MLPLSGRVQLSFVGLVALGCASKPIAGDTAASGSTTTTGESGGTSTEAGSGSEMAWLCSNTDACFDDEYTHIVSLASDPDYPNVLLLQLDNFIGMYVCPLLDELQMFANPPQLFSHFDAALGSITDLDGEPLASFGSSWVTYDYAYEYVMGDFPDFPDRIPILCTAE